MTAMKFYFAVLLVLIFSHLSAQVAVVEEGLPLTLVTALPNCISPSAYQHIDAQIVSNLASISLPQAYTTGGRAATLFDLPVSYTGQDCGYYNISNYVDQNKATGAIQDYRCGQITYDGHTGTDHSIWPFDLYKMDKDLVQVIAAADGVVLAKNDTSYDRNCSFNNQEANYVILLHADGSTSWYYHLKLHSVTSLAIGSIVPRGTVLGTVGSSGISTGPHLHFEIHAGATSATALIDPYTGSCNSLNTTTRWNSQPDYAPAKLVKVFASKHRYQSKSCPTTTYPDESTCYLAGDSLYIYIMGTMSANTSPSIQITNPSGGTYFTATGSNTTYRTWVYNWRFVLKGSDPVGLWTATATYAGQTCSYPFTLDATGCVSAIATLDAPSTLSIHPVPASHEMTIQLPTATPTGAQLYIYDVMGRVACVRTLVDLSDILVVNTTMLSSGIYLARLVHQGVVLADSKLSIVQE
jgi:hypothetical protein